MKRREYGVFLRTRIIALKILSTKSTVKKEKRIACTKYFLRGCSYENSFPVVFPLSRGNTYYFPAFICQMFPRVGEI